MIEISAKCVWLKSGLAANFYNGINVKITRSYFFCVKHVIFVSYISMIFSSNYLIFVENMNRLIDAIVLLMIFCISFFLLVHV